jgi:hypothetical protein
MIPSTSKYDATNQRGPPKFRLAPLSVQVQTSPSLALQIRAVSSFARRLLFCAVWLVLAFVARAVLHGVLANGYYIGSAAEFSAPRLPAGRAVPPDPSLQATTFPVRDATRAKRCPTCCPKSSSFFRICTLQPSQLPCLLRACDTCSVTLCMHVSIGRYDKRACDATSADYFHGYLFKPIAAMHHRFPAA